MTMKPPSHIWLQWYGDASPADHEYDERPEGTTFSTEKVYEDDVCYVRAGKPNQRVQSALIAAEARAAELAAAVDRLRAAAVWKNSYTTPPAHGANVVFANFGGVVAYVAHYHHGGYAPPWYFVPPPIPNEISDEHAADYQEHERLVDLVDRLQRENADLRSQMAAATEWRPVGEGEPPTRQTIEVRTFAKVADIGHGHIIHKAPWGDDELSGGNQLCWWIAGNDWEWRPAPPQE